MSENYKLNVIPVFYSFQGKCIPGGLTLLERYQYLTARGTPAYGAAPMAMQDRGSSLASQLGALVHESGDERLIRAAEKAIERWNTECENFFKVLGPGR